MAHNVQLNLQFHYEVKYYDCKGRKWTERELKGTAKDITGQTCENLTAILPIYYENKTGWLCKCKCGNEVITVISQWGHVKSCGCISIKPPNEFLQKLT